MIFGIKIITNLNINIILSNLTGATLVAKNMMLEI